MPFLGLFHPLSPRLLPPPSTHPPSLRLSPTAHLHPSFSPSISSPVRVRCCRLYRFAFLSLSWFIRNCCNAINFTSTTSSPTPHLFVFSFLCPHHAHERHLYIACHSSVASVVILFRGVVESPFVSLYYYYHYLPTLCLCPVSPSTAAAAMSSCPLFCQLY